MSGIITAEAPRRSIPKRFDERIELGRKVGGAKPSMLQDVEKGRPLELDAIVASVVELGRRAAVDTPSIESVAALIYARDKLATRSG